MWVSDTTDLFVTRIKKISLKRRQISVLQPFTEKKFFIILRTCLLLTANLAKVSTLFTAAKLFY